MTRLIVVALTICLAPGLVLTAASAEEDQLLGWKNELVFNFNLTQASFDNWAQGGENTLGWQMGLNGKFTHLGARHEWANTAKLAYGMQKVGDEDAQRPRPSSRTAICMRTPGRRPYPASWIRAISLRVPASAGRMGRPCGHAWVLHSKRP